MTFPSRISKMFTTRRRIGIPLAVPWTNNVPKHHDVIARVNDLLNVDPEIPELLDELLVPEAVLHVLAPAIDGPIGELRYLVPLDIGIKTRQGGVEVVAVESRIGSPGDLDVLLGHSMGSIRYNVGRWSCERDAARSSGPVSAFLRVVASTSASAAICPLRTSLGRR